MYLMGIDLGGTHIRVALANQHGIILTRRRVRTPVAEGRAAIMSCLIGLVEQLGSEVSELTAIGVGAPGLVDMQAGSIKHAPTLPGWRDVSLAHMLRERMGVPVFLANDASLAALGEYTYGAGKGLQHFLYLTVSTGIGAGIIVDGQLVLGLHGSAGEVGHMIVEPGGAICACGGRGHLETLASGTAIARLAREALATGQQSLLQQQQESGPTGITAADIAQAAEQGDALALDLLKNAGRYLGYAVINLVHLFNPQMIAIGGGVSSANELVFGPMREVVYTGLMPAFQRDFQLVKATLGDDAGIIGAIEFARREIKCGS